MPLRNRSCALLMLLGVVGLTGGSCAPTKRADSANDSSRSSAAPVNDQARLAQLEQTARALARTTGCDSAGGCRIAPVGWRACGGPRDFVAYCAASTDTVALLAALERLKRAEMDYNEKSGMASTCEMRLPPTATLTAGRCTAAR